MARIGPPIIVALCGCGEILVKESIFGEAYWTRYEPYIQHAKKLLARGTRVKSAKCPGCGGDKKVKMGSFFHPAYAVK